MNSTPEPTFPLSRLRERAGVRAGAAGTGSSARNESARARFAREPLIPTLLPQGEKG
jgi:hypothetical protein